MKNIALLAPDFSVEHCQDFIKGVLQYYEKCPDINVFVTQTLFGYDFKGIFDYQYWSGLEILKSAQIDAYIVISSVYCYFKCLLFIAFPGKDKGICFSI